MRACVCDDAEHGGELARKAGVEAGFRLVPEKYGVVRQRSVGDEVVEGCEFPKALCEKVRLELADP